MSRPPIRNHIRRLRQERGLTQEALAQVCRVTRQTVIALEADKYAPSLELAFRLSRALDAPLDAVFEWDASAD